MSRAVAHWHWRRHGRWHWHGPPCGWATLARALARAQARARARRRRASGRYGFRARAAHMRSRHRDGAPLARCRACHRNGSPRAASLGTTQSRHSRRWAGAVILTRRAIGTARVVAHLEQRALSASAEIPTSSASEGWAGVPSKRPAPSAPSKRRGPLSVSLGATHGSIPIAVRGREARTAAAIVAISAELPAPVGTLGRSPHVGVKPRRNERRRGQSRRGSRVSGRTGSRSGGRTGPTVYCSDELGHARRARPPRVS